MSYVSDHFRAYDKGRKRQRPQRFKVWKCVDCRALYDVLPYCKAEGGVAVCPKCGAVGEDKFKEARVKD